ncbi:hypothetical protein [Dielma fastidiosa]|uniref:Uncharacterized protein n=1 Tax=Dielma fastidiosa TaxID=1034346 RepID=A0A318KN53_9FIRM|nr:hypothetical protein [Dielma fastidiosa]PXX77106.1 hypothetical protein DES51_11246 [Dielma fastidiosa]RHN01604.1 hypothetical protein DWZ33_06325 [Dielma fastidiosa]
MQAIFESIFDILYLITVITLGITMIRKSNGNAQFKLFGIMAVVLGCGDAFHLVPRVYAMWTTGMEANAAPLGFGQFITSITMTVFYCILYNVYVKRYDIKNDAKMKAVIYGLAIIRVILCFMPQNDWLSPDAPLLWGVLRNIPFALLGLIIIVLFYKQAKLHNDQQFKYMWLAIVLSFGFYIPVVLFAKTYPLAGMLMIPKTCAYVWIVWMGYSELKKS